MNQIIKKLMLITLIPSFTCAHLSLIQKNPDSTYKIAFLKEKLIKTPEKQSESKSLMLLLGSFISIPILFSKYLHNIQDNTLRYNAKLITLMGPIYITLTVYLILLNKQCNIALLKFIEEWKSNKQYTPKELLHSFEMLYDSKNPLDPKKVKELHAKIYKMLSKEKAPKTKQLNVIEKAKWEKLIQVFIIQPQEQFPMNYGGMKLLASLINGTVIGIISLFYTDIIHPEYYRHPAGSANAYQSQKIKQWSWSWNNPLELCLSTFYALTGMVATYYYILDRSTTMKQGNTLRNFLKNWETNKQNTPAKLIPLLDDACLKYKENPNHPDLAETARIIETFTKNKQKTIKTPN